MSLRLREALEYTLTAAIFLGLLMVVIGISSWALEIIRQIDTSWQLQLALVGVLLMIFASLACRIFSRLEW